MGITDEDLKYIHKNGEKSYRVSIPTSYGRETKVLHSLIDAIKYKYQLLDEIAVKEKATQEEKQTLSDAKSGITAYSTVADGIKVYLLDRNKDSQHNFIAIPTYEQDLSDFKMSKYLNKSGIFEKKIIDVTDEYAQEFVDYLWDIKVENGKNTGKTLAPNTVYKPFSFIRKVFNYFKKQLKIIKDNPFDNVKRKPQAVAVDKEYLTEEEIRYLKSKVEFENIRFRTLVTLILDNGLRREEALGLKFKDLNSIHETIYIKRAVVKSKLDNRYIVKQVKTKKSERLIIITAHTIELINKLRDFKVACGFIVKDDDFVFTGWESLDLVDPNNYSKEFKSFMKKIGIKKDIPLKNLRHTNTTFFVARGENIKAVQNRVGHENIETTLTYYAQANSDEDRKLVNTYEQVFYNKLGLSMSEIYKLVSNRITDTKKIITVLEKIGNEYIDDTNYDLQLERCQEYLKELFPLVDKVLQIDSLLSEKEIDALFDGVTYLYKNIKIETLDPELKI